MQEAMKAETWPGVSASSGLALAQNNDRILRMTT
jgi:hypothetical protein